jgi:DNA-3-methyladenine glycosylase
VSGAGTGVLSTAAAERLETGFFARSVHAVARELVGCRLFYEGCGGTIVETESYERDDPACHAYAGLTQRTATLFGPPGRAYVYLSYGIHSLLNAVAEPEGEAAAVLIRALEPTAGLEQMRARRGERPDTDLCSGPGKLTDALGLDLDANGAVRLATTPGIGPIPQPAVIPPPPPPDSGAASGAASGADSAPGAASGAGAGSLAWGSGAASVEGSTGT